MFVIRALGIAFVLLALTFAVNVWVDPYGFNGTGSSRFSREISETWVQDFKFTQVARRRPAIIALGNSRTWRGISPDNSVLLKGGYNFASPSLGIGDFLDQLKFAQSCGPLHEVVVLLDPNAFEGNRGRVVMRPEINYRKCAPELFPIPLRYFRENISVEQLLASLSVLLGRSENSYAADGTDVTPSESDTEARAHLHFLTNLQSYLQGGWYTREGVHGEEIVTRDSDGHDSFDDLKAFFEFAADHHIRVIAVFPPLHADLQMVALLRNMQYGMWDMKYRVLNLADAVNVRRGGNIVVYDFLTVNPLTTAATIASPTSNAPFHSNYVDYSHFLPVVGTQMMSIIANVPGSVRLTQENFAAKKAAGMAALAAYRSRATFVMQVARDLCGKNAGLVICRSLAGAP